MHATGVILIVIVSLLILFLYVSFNTDIGNEGKLSEATPRNHDCHIISKVARTKERLI